MKPRELLRELLGVGLLGLAVFLLASIVSFDVADLPHRVAPANAEPSNWGGSVGAWLAGFLLEWVGTLGALGCGGILLALGWSCLRDALAAEDAPPRPKVEPLRRVVGGVIAVLMLAVLERVLCGGLLAQWGGADLLARGLPAGGVWGLFLEVELGRHLGGGGAPIAVTVALAAGLILTADRPVRELLGLAGQQAQAVAARAAESARAAEEALAIAAPEAPAAGAPAPVRAPVDLDAPEPTAPANPASAARRDEREDEDDDADEAAEASPADLVPPVELLTAAEPSAAPAPVGDERGALIEDTLTQFKLAAKVVAVERGPAVTLFALELGRGIKVQRLAGLLDNLAIALRVPGIRLQAPIPGTSWVGLEVPNEEQEVVRFRELVEHPGWRDKDPALPLFLGKDSSGRPLIADLAKMPHLLIAGATGAGKSVCINGIILSLLMTRGPRDVQLILIDPKQVELAQFAKVPHLKHPVVTDMRQAGAVLAWAVKAMEERYTWLARAGVRHIKEYNALGKEEVLRRFELDEAGMNRSRIPWKLPYVVLVVDELNDLMMVAQKEVEASITRLAQKSRAVGIHVVLATQRPSVDVLTGVIKSNLPARIAFRVTSKVDSRTILDASGADKLLGQGDMLFLPPGRSQPIRAQGALITDKEIKAVVKALGKSLGRGGKPDFSEDLQEEINAAAGGAGAPAGEGGERDESYTDAVRVVLAAGKGSVSLIQRKLQVGYARAARMLDLMSDEGIVGPPRGSKAREVKTTLEEFEARG